MRLEAALILVAAGACVCDAPPDGPPGSDKDGGVLLHDGGDPDGGGAASDGGDTGPDGGANPGVDAGPGLPGRDCPAPPATTPLLADIAGQFAAEVYPLMTRTDGAGCLDCHADDENRIFRMGQTGEETFYRARAGGFLRLIPGSMLDRLDQGTMPDQGTPWTQDERDRVFDVACQVAAIDSAGVPPDEEFPADLLLPYTGPAATDYDNTFLTYDQLRNRIIQQFEDDWVRNSVDKFSENIALFGGVDFLTTFIPARQATPEFFVGLDLLSEDVCARAATDGTGPFTGLDLDAPIREEPPSSTNVYEAENQTSFDYNGDEMIPGWDSYPRGGPTVIGVYSVGGFRFTYDAPIAGDYRITVRADSNEGGPDLPLLEVHTTGSVVGDTVPEGSYTDNAFDVPLVAGPNTVEVWLANDYYDPDFGLDLNMYFDKATVEGPLPGSTGGAAGARDATIDAVATVFARMLLRAPIRDTNETELGPLYDTLIDLEDFAADRTAAWSGVCQALMQHPDFLFTRPGRFDVAGDDAAGVAERARLLVIKTAFDLLDRPPTDAELSRFDTGETRAELIDEWLATDAWRDAYYKRVRLILESDGSVDGDEPARLWTYVMAQDRPLKEILTADYTVDEALAPATRPAEHGQTGLLTMQGYIRGKPGLPHYNYAARVLTGFLGFVFEVPPEVFEQRATATAASTVDPTSICYTCHQMLTPLAHQRLKWADDGTYRTTFDDGRPIDDTDHGLVATYPYRGPGLESFSLVAVRKEGFIRRMANLHFQLSFGRLLRHDADERTLYKALWDAADHGEGTFRDVMKTVLMSSAYVDPVGSHVVEAP